MNIQSPNQKSDCNKLAVIGMSCRFPGAPTVEAYWDILKHGKETISHFTDKELIDEGVDESLLRQVNYVKAKGIIDDIELFDAAFFGFTADEACKMDPQQRLFLECSYEALSGAGYLNGNDNNLVGVFAGMSQSTYCLEHLIKQRQELSTPELVELAIGSFQSFLATKVSYALNLLGPSLNINTACSTSLVSIATACKYLLEHDCDIALAGGASLSFPHKRGYLHKPNSFFSSDGHCRTFDKDAEGTVPSSGVGVVVLKRLDDAIRDRDHIEAVISGFAINNDGGNKASFSAPSMQRQADCIKAAQQCAGVQPEAISYIEAHGSGTLLGDAIEVESLRQVFLTCPEHHCALGAVKTNIGHPEAASGVAGFIKVILSLKHKILPPTLHYQTSSPHLDLGNSPFYVPTEALAWMGDGDLLRAGVSSFGIGGTNAHVILEEAPMSEKKTKIQTHDAFNKNQYSFQESAVLSCELGDSVEQGLYDIIYNILGSNTIDINKSFFSLGGNSLSALRFITRLKDKYAIDTNFLELYNFSTIVSMVSFFSDKILRA